MSGRAGYQSSVVLLGGGPLALLRSINLSIRLGTRAREGEGVRESRLKSDMKLPLVFLSLNGSLNLLLPPLTAVLGERGSIFFLLQEQKGTCSPSCFFGHDAHHSPSFPLESFCCAAGLIWMSMKSVISSTLAGKTVTILNFDNLPHFSGS